MDSYTLVDPTLQPLHLVRAIRDALLTQADTVHCNAERWALMTIEQQELWRAYKQELRDITKDLRVDSLQWPILPV